MYIDNDLPLTVIEALERARNEARAIHYQTGKNVSIAIKMKKGRITYRVATVNLH